VLWKRAIGVFIRGDGYGGADKGKRELPTRLNPAAKHARVRLLWPRDGRAGASKTGDRLIGHPVDPTMKGDESEIVVRIHAGRARLGRTAT
jgi:hypothetical protein